MLILYENALAPSTVIGVTCGGCAYHIPFPTFLRNRLPVGGGCVYVLQLFILVLFFLFFFCFFSVHQNYETTVLGNG